MAAKEAKQHPVYKLCWLVIQEPSYRRGLLKSLHLAHKYPPTWGLFWDVHPHTSFLKLLVPRFLILWFSSLWSSSQTISCHLQSYLYANWTTRNAALSSALWDHFPSQCRLVLPSGVPCQAEVVYTRLDAGWSSKFHELTEHLLLLHCLPFPQLTSDLVEVLLRPKRKNSNLVYRWLCRLWLAPARSTMLA